MQNRRTNNPRYLPDTLKQVAQTTDHQVMRLARAFRERIAMVRGRRR